MPIKEGILVQLKDTAGRTINVSNGKVIVIPGQQFGISICITNDFEWHNASRLYVEIASRDANAPPAKRDSWNGKETQVLCIRADALAVAHEITSMRTWDIHGFQKEPTKKPFTMPPPYLGLRSAEYKDEKPPDLQSRRGCVQVLVRRGHLRSSGGTYKRRAADPREHSQEEYRQPYQYINPLWFTALKGAKGTSVVFEFENTSSETALTTEQEPVGTQTPERHVVATAMMQSPAEANSRSTKKNSSISCKAPTKARGKVPLPKPKLQPTIVSKPVDHEARSDHDNITVAPRKLSVIKRSLNESRNQNQNPVRSPASAAPQRVSSKRGRPLRTPSPSVGSDTAHTPSSIGLTMPMSSQKKRRLEFLRLEMESVQLKQEEVGLKKKMLLEMDDED